MELAKERFIEKLKTAEQKNTPPKVPTTFCDFANYYFDTFRVKKVSKQTLENDRYRLKNHIIPHFGKTELKNITLANCQELIDKLTEEGKGKTCDEVYSILNQIFKYAIANDLIKKNPMTLVFHIKHEREHGTALSKEEEKNVISSFRKTRYFPQIILSLYCGLRPNELESARIEDQFIIAINSKRKGKKIEYKRIPITPMLKPHIKELILENQPPLRSLQSIFFNHFPSHRLYDLRTTFNTRCQECGVAPVALSEFMGHSLGALQKAYTDLSNEFLLKEGAKVNY